MKPIIWTLAESKYRTGVDEGGLTLLHWAADRGYTDIADHILQINPSIINYQVISFVWQPSVAVRGIYILLNTMVGGGGGGEG